MVDPSPPPPVLEAEGVIRILPGTREGRGQTHPSPAGAGPGPGEQAVLRGVGFRLEAGSFTTIMGPSGSGKSTLLHLLAGLDVASAGAIRLLGQDLGEVSEEERSRLRREHIGFVFQFFNLLPDLTVEENVRLPLLIAGRRIRKADKERLERVMERLGVAGLRGRRPMGLSGGEMQRVSIARALAAEPELLLCDEPTGNLSSKAGEEVVALLRELAGSPADGEAGGGAPPVTVLLVTHNPRDAAAGDRVLFLDDGTLDPSNCLTGGPFDASDVHRRLEELGI